MGRCPFDHGDIVSVGFKDEFGAARVAGIVDSPDMDSLVVGC
jgi:hypothetical protein